MEHLPRIVVIGNARSGTTMFLNALKSHPKLTMLDEILAVIDPGSEQTAMRRQAYKKCYNKELSLLEPGSLLIDFKEVNLYPFMKEMFDQSNGFKLLFWHTAPFYKNVWDNLKKFQPHIVYIERNPVECFVSEALATRSGIWNTTEEKDRYHSEQIVLPRSSIKAIKSINHKPNRFMISYGKHFQITKINYHDLLKNWDAITQNLQKNIGLDFHPLEISNKKVLFRDTCSYVKNWREFSTWCIQEGIEVPENPKRKILI